MKNLVIVESPAKAKTIEKFLGKNYKVIASKGHIRDLPAAKFGVKIDVENKKVEPTYTTTVGHKDIVKEIKTLAKKSDKVYIATDDDREGEAIGYHITKVLRKPVDKFPRIVFHEITKRAIQEAIKNPRVIDLNKVNAQQARRVLDRVVGYTLSPLLAKKIMKGLSAGRVQSATLNLIVKREEEIQNFNKEEYWFIKGVFKNKDEATLVKYNNKKLSKMSIRTKEEADKIINTLKDKTFTVTKVGSKESSGKPIPPFTTSSLQQAASTRLGFSTSKTMQIAQKLYEGKDTPKGRLGLITYMRTDSTNIAKEAQQEALKTIETKFGKEYVESHTFTKRQANAQEAHECIRPTHLELEPDDLKDYLTKDELKLYKLIYERFLASQMTPPKYKITNVILSNNETGSDFKLQGKQLVFPGYLKVYENNQKDEIISEYKENETLKPKEVKGEQHFTEPPPRYTEASLVKEMEKLDIGRPSTYAATITLLKNRNYVTVENKKLVPTENAFKVIKILREHFPEIVDANFTANMEDTLDKIAAGQQEWQQTIIDFFVPFRQKVDDGYKNIPSLKKEEDIGRACPKCGSPLVKKQGRYGEFIACSAFPKCKYIESIKKEPEYVEDVKCPECGGRLVVKYYKNKKFYGCENYPNCKFTTNSLNKLRKEQQ